MVGFGYRILHSRDTTAITTSTSSIDTTTTIPTVITTSIPNIITTITTTINSICPPELIYGEFSQETELLRKFRDNILSTTPEGRQLIELYYQWAPVVIEAMEHDEDCKDEVNVVIDGFLETIREVVD